MSTLLLKLSGPLQSWGIDSKFEIRRTEREPSKSGVTGLLAAALGRDRADSIEDLDSLYFGVRVDKEGVLLSDFQTAQSSKSYVIRRHYLADAVFLVGLESDDEEFIDQLVYAVTHPVYPLYLGRRSCPPAGPVFLGRRECHLMEALENEPWLLSDWQKSKIKGEKQYLRLITDARPGKIAITERKDRALSFDGKKRVYGYRPVIIHKPVEIVSFMKETEHDIMGKLF